MKKAIKINLNGLIFHIDEDAYERLKKYLDAIGKHFSNKTEGEEILKDIESRIAELFLEKKTKENEVISINLVEQVIEIMGDPEEIIDSSEQASSTNESSGTYYSSRQTRRLYRDPENSVFSGVCGGLGAYFNIDPLIFRVLFIVFLFAGGASILLYLILWIVLPKALTAAQKLEMRGEPVNVSNIERKVREEYDTAKENVKAAANSEQAKKAKKATGDFFSDLGKVLLVFIKIVLIIIGTLFIISGIGILIGLISGAFVGLHIFPFNHFGFSLGELLTPFTDPVNLSLLIIAMSLLIIIPVIAMIYGIIKLIFAIKTHNRGATIGAATLWLVALLLTLGILVMETGNYSDPGRTSNVSDISVTSDTLYITINTDQKNDFERNIDFNFDLDKEWFITNDLDRIYGEVELDIEASDTDQFRLEVEKRSKGRNNASADENARKIQYYFQTTNNVLVLDPYFFIGGDDDWRFPSVHMTLEVPEGKYIFLERETRNILDNAYNKNHISNWRMSDKMWHMTEQGLELIDE